MTWNNWDEYNDWDSAGKSVDHWKSKKKPKGGWVRCWEENHKPLAIGGGTVLGAACAHPADGYDIYVGFDHGMKFKHTAFPWEQKKDPVVEFLFPISDMCAPKSPKQFKAMIEWMSAQLALGKKIHMGCIGGHGRTGLVLAALVAHVNGEKDAIQWVRKHHCKKAVESESQVNFLMKHFKVKKAKPTKGGSYTSGKSSKGQYSMFGTKDYHSPRESQNCEIKAIRSTGCVW